MKRNNIFRIDVPNRKPLYIFTKYGWTGLTSIINDENATNDGLSLEVFDSTSIIDSNIDLLGAWVYIPLKNNETDIDAVISVSLTFYGDDEPLHFDYENHGFELPNQVYEYTKILKAGEEGTYCLQYSGLTSIVEHYETFKIIATVTAAPNLK